MENIFAAVKKASISNISDDKINKVLLSLADKIESKTNFLLEANARDLALMDPANPLYDRLKLSPERLSGIASDMRNVASLPSPLGRELSCTTRPNGLIIKKISVPFGVVGVIYEARPNVTFDVFSICLKSGNACLLKGGRDADNSNRAAVELIKSVLREEGLDENLVGMMPATHEATAEMLGAVGYVDVVIPRGGRKLIDFVRNNAKVPCIETGAGVVNTYFDKDADLEMGTKIILNAKTRRVSVCNALDCLIINSSRLCDLPAICSPLEEKKVALEADERAYKALEGRYSYLEKADSESFGTEFMDYRMAIKTVDSLDEAIGHIASFGPDTANASSHQTKMQQQNSANGLTPPAYM